ncbi:MAG: hypothetical protein K2P22_06110, partial [Lachnospiraceae bacterium]|nr:hypothetical protein [Lachnospiraceae bacterium]
MANDGTVKIGVDFSADDIKRGYKTIQDEGKKTANSLKSVNNALKLDPKNVDLLTEKQKLLTKAVASSELEVSELTKELEKAKASGMDETDAEGYRELVLALSEATVEAQQYNAELREINQELNFDHGSADVLVEKQRLLTKALAEAEAQASELSEALEQAREAGLDSEDAEGYRELSEALEQAQQQARQYADELENLSENTDECTDDTDSLSESLAGSVLAGQLAAESFGFLMEKIGELVQWVLNLNEATEEYRVAQAKLNTAFEAAGYSADVANQAFSSFYGILGDIDTAAEASQLLASLARSEEDVAKWTQIAAGVYGTFGDALPIEGLIEAANETAKTGQVTGVLADALNWAGESEDAFNESLALLNDEGKRAELIMNNLGIIYGETGDIFRENNETIMESREANLRFQESMSRLAESIQPFLTTLTQMATTFMDWFNGIPDGAQAAVVGVVAFLAVISPIAGIITAITGALGAAGIASTTFSIAGTAVSLTLGQWVIVIGVVIAAVLALAAAIAFLTGRGKELQSMKMPEVPDYSGAVQGGGRRSGGPSLQSDGPSAAPMALSDGDTASSPLSREAPARETARPKARSRVIYDLG